MTASEIPPVLFREAVVSFSYRGETEEEALEAVWQSLDQWYPERRMLLPMPFRAMALRQGETPVHLSEDQRTAVQVRADTFTFSRRAPYPGWAALRDEARRAWTVARPELGEISFRSLGVRFANVLRLPGGVDDLGSYLTAAPAPPKAIEGATENYYIRWTIQLPHRRAHARVTQASRPPHQPGWQRVLLDIDVIARRSSALDEAEIWEEIEYLREAGHRIFRQSLTPLANQWVP